MVCEILMLQVSNMKMLFVLLILFPIVVYGNKDSTNHYDTHLVDHQLKHEAHERILKEVVHAKEHEMKSIPLEKHENYAITPIHDVSHLTHKSETEKDKLKDLRWHWKINKGSKKDKNEQLQQKKNQHKLTKLHLKSHEPRDMVAALIKHIDIAKKTSKSSQLPSHQIRMQMSDEPVHTKNVIEVQQKGNLNKKVDKKNWKSKMRNRKLLRRLNTSKKSFLNKSNKEHGYKNEAPVDTNAPTNNVMSNKQAHDNHAVNLKKVNGKSKTSGKRMSGDKKHMTSKLNADRRKSRLSRNHQLAV